MTLAAHHEQLRDAVRRYARERLAPNAARWDREKVFPREEVAGLGAMGLYGISIPEAQGGAGMDCTALALACEEIAAGDGATCTIIMVNNLVANILQGYGNEAQKKEFLAPMARGETLGAFCLTEPHAGSDASTGVIISRSLKPVRSIENSRGLPPWPRASDGFWRKYISTRPLGAQVGPSTRNPSVSRRSPCPSGRMTPI